MVGDLPDHSPTGRTHVGDVQGGISQCTHFTGIMNLKKEEFRNLRQGNRTLKEYMDDFYTLSRYAPEDIDTDGKRREKFLRGLCDELKVPLSVAYTPNYQTLLDQAITLEDNIKKAENRKRKLST